MNRGAPIASLGLTPRVPDMNRGAPIASLGLAPRAPSPGASRTLTRLQALRGRGEVRRAALPAPYDLAPGQEDTVSLPALLERVLANSQGARKFHAMLTQRMAAFGLEVPALHELIADPGALINRLVLPVSALKDIANTASALSPNPDAPPAPKLAAGTDILSAFSAELPDRTLKEVAPGVLRGWPASSIGDAEALKAVRMAKVFNTLVENIALPEEEHIPLTYKGESFTDFAKLLGRLEGEGHHVEIVYEQRIADFLGLHSVENGVRRPVAAPLMIDTLFRDEAGELIVIPATHGELQVRISPPEGQAGVDANLRFYQGTETTGFMPNGLEQPSRWAGRVRSGALGGAKAWETLRLAGDLESIIRSIAGARHLRLGGYGVTGVCDDTTSALSQFHLGEALFYPRLLDPGLLRGEIAAWREAGRGDDARLATLDGIVAGLEPDTSPRAEQLPRILASITSDVFARTPATRRALEHLLHLQSGVGIHAGE